MKSFYRVKKMSEHKRTGKKERATSETKVQVNLDLDGSGISEIKTGIGFLNHMLELLAKHAAFDLKINAEGDLDVDSHHTTEDVGIVFGEAFKEALGDKKGINRFADVSLPMQDSLVKISLDICGRPHLEYVVHYPTEKIGDFDTNLVEEFLHAFVTHAGITMHIEGVRGSNSHHIAEAEFKALARVLKKGCEINPNAQNDIPSTKGSL